jgi:hypothetical protein
MENCKAIARVNRVGNGFNGHRGDYTCTAAGTTTAVYTVRTDQWIDGRLHTTTGTTMLPVCDRHATSKMAWRRTVKVDATKAVR